MTSPIRSLKPPADIDLGSRETVQRSLQFTLWEQHELRSNLVALYDLAPRYVYAESDKNDKGVIEREFEVSGREYRITIKPTKVKTANGTRYVDCYPGAREQVVEDAIRRLASNRARLHLDKDQHVRFSFSLYELRKELLRVNRAMNLSEIKEALMILSEVRFTIEPLDNPNLPVLMSSAFPEIVLRKGLDDERENVVQFNSLVAQSIRLVDYHSFDYETLMALKSPIARWLYRRLYVDILNSGEPVQRMSAQTIQTLSGMPQWKTERNMLRRTREAVQSLQEHGLLDLVEATPIRQRNRITDWDFTMSASPALMTAIRQSRRRRMLSLEALQAAAPVTNARDIQFLPISDHERVRIGDLLNISPQIEANFPADG